MTPTVNIDQLTRKAAAVRAQQALTTMQSAMPQQPPQIAPPQGSQLPADGLQKNETPTPVNQASTDYLGAVNAAPDVHNFHASIGRRVLAMLAGAGAGVRGGDAFKTAQGITQAPYNQAVQQNQQDVARKGQILSALQGQQAASDESGYKSSEIAKNNAAAMQERARGDYYNRRGTEAKQPKMVWDSERGVFIKEDPNDPQVTQVLPPRYEDPNQKASEKKADRQSQEDFEIKKMKIQSGLEEGRDERKSAREEERDVEKFNRRQSERVNTKGLSVSQQKDAHDLALKEVYAQGKKFGQFINNSKAGTWYAKPDDGSPEYKEFQDALDKASQKHIDAAKSGKSKGKFTILDK